MTGSLSAARRWTIVAAALVLAHAGWQGWQVAAAAYPARYEYDEGVYAATAAAAADGARLYQDAFLSQPPLLVATLAHAYRALGPSLAVARGIVVLFSTLWLAAVFAILARTGRARAGTLAVCALLGSPAFLAAAHTVQMEGPSEALAAAAVALALRGASRPGVLWWAAAGAAGTLALTTKLTAAACAVPLLGAVLLSPPGSRARRFAALAGGAALAAAPLLASLPGGALSQVIAFHLAVARHMGTDPQARLAAVRGFLAANWPLAAAAAWGVGLAAAQRDRRAWIVGTWLGADGAIAMALTPLWPHHLAILLSPLALLAGIGADALAESLARPAAPRPGPRAAAPSTYAVLGAAAVLAYLARGPIAAGVPGSSRDLVHAVAEMTRRLPADAAVLTDDPMVPFLAHRRVPPALADTSVARFRSGDLSLPVLRRALQDSRIGGVLLWRGTLQHEVPGVLPAAATRFAVRVDLGRGRMLLVPRLPPGHRTRGEGR